MLGKTSQYVAGWRAARRLGDWVLAAIATAASLAYALLAMSPAPAAAGLVLCVVATGSAPERAASF